MTQRIMLLDANILCILIIVSNKNTRIFTMNKISTVILALTLSFYVSGTAMAGGNTNPTQPATAPSGSVVASLATSSAAPSQNTTVVVEVLSNGNFSVSSSSGSFLGTTSSAFLAAFLSNY